MSLPHRMGIQRGILNEIRPQAVIITRNVSNDNYVKCSLPNSEKKDQWYKTLALWWDSHMVFYITTMVFYIITYGVLYHFWTFQQLLVDFIMLVTLLQGLGYGKLDLDGLVQERLNSIANALELRLSCSNPSIYHFLAYSAVVSWRF